MRPGSPPAASQGRLAELPPEHQGSWMPKRASCARVRAESIAILLSSGATPCWQPRLVARPRSCRLGWARVSCTIASRSAGRIPSRRSPSSTINSTPWRNPCACAAAARAWSTRGSLLQLIAAWATTRSTSWSMGERTISSGTRRGERCRASIVSMRDSPMEVTPAAIQVATISRRPRVALLTPVTAMPTRPRRSTRVRALWCRRWRWISSRGAFTRPRRAGVAVRVGAGGRRAAPSPPAIAANNARHR